MSASQTQSYIKGRDGIDRGDSVGDRLGPRRLGLDVSITPRVMIPPDPAIARGRKGSATNEGRAATHSPTFHHPGLVVNPRGSIRWRPVGTVRRCDSSTCSSPAGRPAV